jgi:acyl carrier protein
MKKPKNYQQMRKMIIVFHQYGITLLGQRKFDNLYQDLNMDTIFVLGLIYELELVTQIELNDEEVYSLQAPAQIINKLFIKNIEFNTINL